ncbi:MAG: DUF6514 family protein [Eubacteriales bacterium]|nr:DUF6514 family protein [Eubacteriales bacterium]
MVCYRRTTKRDSEHRIWYGVAAVEDGRVVERMDDLTTDDDLVGKLLEQLNTGHASRIHFAEIIEDFMAQLSYI